MRRQECERKILEKLDEIYDLFQQYGGGDMLSLSVATVDGEKYVSMFNRYWEEDRPLRATEIGGERVRMYD